MTLRRPMYRASNCPLFMCAYKLPPVSAAHHNRIRFIILLILLRFLFVRVTLFASGSTFKFALVVINSQVNLRHVTVPVNSVSYCH